jgi:catechol 2,3-dioxygenase-like lactoylglutathione lyase family enzyme
MRSDSRTYDYGLFDIAFRVKNLDAVYEHLSEKGFTFIAPPKTFEADWTHVTVKDAIMLGPNRFYMPFIERISEPKPLIQGAFDIMLDVAQFVEDMEEVISFYVDILGMSKVFDQLLPRGLINDVVGLPDDADARLVFIQEPESNAPMLEFIECTARGKSLADFSKPPNIGLFSIALETIDLSSLKAKLRTKGYQITCEIDRRSIENHKMARAIKVLGPSGVSLEFFE